MKSQPFPEKNPVYPVHRCESKIRPRSTLNRLPANRSHGRKTTRELGPGCRATAVSMRQSRPASWPFVVLRVSSWITLFLLFQVSTAPAVPGGSDESETSNLPGLSGVGPSPVEPVIRIIEHRCTGCTGLTGLTEQDVMPQEADRLDDRVAVCGEPQCPAWPFTDPFRVYSNPLESLPGPIHFVPSLLRCPPSRPLAHPAQAFSNAFVALRRSSCVFVDNSFLFCFRQALPPPCQADHSRVKQPIFIAYREQGLCRVGPVFRITEHRCTGCTG